MLGLLVRDVVLTRGEVEALMAGPLVSDEPPRGRERFEDWLSTTASTLGRSYQSGLRRNFRGPS